MSKFWKSELEPGYYDKVLSKGLEKGKGIQTNWHYITLLNVQLHIKESDKHLDYACGPGTLIGKFSNADSIGVDIAESQIQYAKNKYEEAGEFFSLDEFEFNDYKNYFDVVTILGLIEFLSDKEIQELLSKVYSSLKPGGKLILTTPNFNSLIYPISDRLSLVNWSGEHKNKFNSKKLRLFLANTSFKSFNVKKILSIGMLASFISINIGLFFEKLLRITLFQSQGFVIMVELKK